MGQALIEYVLVVESPCTDICVIDGETGWCLGCGRTLDEIAMWGESDPATREAVMSKLPSRMNALQA